MKRVKGKSSMKSTKSTNAKKRTSQNRTKNESSSQSQSEGKSRGTTKSEPLVPSRGTTKSEPLMARRGTTKSEPLMASQIDVLLASKQAEEDLTGLDIVHEVKNMETLIREYKEESDQLQKEYHTMVQRDKELIHREHIHEKRVLQTKLFHNRQRLAFVQQELQVQQLLLQKQQQQQQQQQQQTAAARSSSALKTSKTMQTQQGTLVTVTASKPAYYTYGVANQPKKNWKQTVDVYVPNIDPDTCPDCLTPCIFVPSESRLTCPNRKCGYSTTKLVATQASQAFGEERMEYKTRPSEQKKAFRKVLHPYVQGAKPIPAVFQNAIRQQMMKRGIHYVRGYKPAIVKEITKQLGLEDKSFIGYRNDAPRICRIMCGQPTPAILPVTERELIRRYGIHHNRFALGSASKQNFVQKGMFTNRELRNMAAEVRTLAEDPKQQHDALVKEALLDHAKDLQQWASCFQVPKSDVVVKENDMLLQHLRTAAIVDEQRRQEAIVQATAKAKAQEAQAQARELEFKALGIVV